MFSFLVLVLNWHTYRAVGWWPTNILIQYPAAMNSRVNLRPLNENELDLVDQPFVLFSSDTADAISIGYLLIMVISVFYWDTYILLVKWYFTGGL